MVTAELVQIFDEIKVKHSTTQSSQSMSTATTESQPKAEVQQPVDDTRSCERFSGCAEDLREFEGKLCDHIDERLRPAPVFADSVCGVRLGWKKVITQEILLNL